MTLWLKRYQFYVFSLRRGGGGSALSMRSQWVCTKSELYGSLVVLLSAENINQQTIMCFSFLYFTFLDDLQKAPELLVSFRNFHITNFFPSQKKIPFTEIHSGGKICSQTNAHQRRQEPGTKRGPTLLHPRYIMTRSFQPVIGQKSS